MKIYRHWARISETISVDALKQEVTCFGGSNSSMEEATQRAREKIEGVRRKIAGDGRVFAGYQVEIREELLTEPGPGAAVTRNRYGAAVLNCERLLIIDIDEPRLGFWKSLFGSRPTGAAKRAEIRKQVTERVAGSAWSGLSIRLYDTAAGARLIVTGRDFDPAGQEAQDLMRDVNADALYANLCRRQRCFRARLTPKPHRLRCKTTRVVFPRDADQEETHAAWVAQYEAASQGRATTHYVESMGRRSQPNALVDFHDRETRAHEKLSLA